MPDTLKMTVEARSVNEGFARAAVAAFAARLDPNLEELADIKTAVSEAVTNCIIHWQHNSRKSSEFLVRNQIIL